MDPAASTAAPVVDEGHGFAPPEPAIWETWLDADRWMLTAVVAGVCGLALALAISVLLKRLRRRPTASVQDSVLQEIRVTDLRVAGPGNQFPRLEVYGTPVRLAVLVLAPVGRQSVLPPAELLPMVWESLVPGLNELVVRDAPLLRFWPVQLSSQGFAQVFFHHLALPGDHGRGTPWCALAGKVDWGGKQYLVGMAACGDSPNGLNMLTLQHQGQWLDAIRIRKAA